jgi:Spx/MgsR family transcriptional regulator
MLKIKVYEYPKCSTCQKAMKYLNGKKIEVERIDITAQPPTVKELETMLACYDGDVRKLFNTSGQVYRELALGEKLKSMSQ